MTTASHTPLPFGGPLTSAAMEAPLGQLDAAIASVMATGSGGAATSLTAQALSGQKNMVVADRANWVVGDVFWIGAAGGTHEVGVIASGTGAGAGTLVAVANLASTYAIGTPVTKSPIELVDARGSQASLGVRLNLFEGQAFNVKAAPYNAKGDGATDDRAAVAAAITAAQAVHGVVFFPPGNYRNAGAAWSVTEEIQIIGSGGWSGGTIITMVTANTGAFDFSALADHSRIAGIKFVGPGAAASGSCLILSKTVHLEDVWIVGFFNGITLSTGGTYYAQFNRVFVQDCTGTGLLIASGAYNLTLIGFRAHNCATGISWVTITSFKMFGGSIEQCTTRGIEATGVTSRTALFEGVYFESAVGSEDVRIGGAGTIERVVFVNCHFQDNAIASYWHLNVFGVTGLLFIGCYLGAAGAGGGSIQSATGNTQDVLLLGTTVLGTKTLNAATRVVSILSEGLSMVVTGTRAAVPSAVQTLVAGTTILANAETVLITAASPVTITAAPTIASANLDGQVITLMNVGTNNITIQDQGTLALSNLRLTATTVVLGPRDSIQLVYVSAIADWIQIGNLVAVL